VVAYFFLREPAVLNVGLIAISLLIPALKLGLAPRTVALHYLAILVTFGALFLRSHQAAVCVAHRARGVPCRGGDALRRCLAHPGQLGLHPGRLSRLRSERGERRRGRVASCRHHRGGVADRTVLVCCVQMADGRHRDDAAPPTYGSASVDWLLPAAATALAVFAAAALVELLNLAQGQWVMWSAASVVVGDLSAVTGKLKLRAVGALIGVPLGFLPGIAPPESRAGYSFAVLGATLTLIAFSRYAVGFGTRCFFIALAASFAGGASGIAEERVANVIIGGVFGLVAVALMELVWRRVGAGKVGLSQ
jgi:Fusaric acid resistance protein-like